MSTIRIRKLRVKIVVVPAVINLLICFGFLLLRPAGISFLKQREAMRRNSGQFFINSADPIFFIAERPLYQWNEWHGDEAMWVKIVEILNYVPLAAARVTTKMWAAYAAPRNIGSFRADTWLLAWVYLMLSSLQWLLVGVVLSRISSGLIRAPAALDASQR